MAQQQMTEDECQRLAVVEAHLSAISRLTSDPGAIDEIDGLLAADFIWQTPSTDAERGVVRDRNSYITMLARPDLLPAAERFADLKLTLLDATVQGLRIAGETMSDGKRADGLRYSNRYHQLWQFNPANEITNYRIYADTQNIASIHAQGIKLVALAFLDCIARRDGEGAMDLVAHPFNWVVRRGPGEVRIDDRQAALRHIADEAAGELAPRTDGVMVHGDRVVIEIDELSGAWRNMVMTVVGGRIAEIREYRSGAAEAIV